MLPILVEDHLLWPDGSISVDPDKVTDFIFKITTNSGDLKKLYVTEITPEIASFNEVSEHKLEVKSTCKFPFPEWILPEKYKYIDLNEYLIGLVELIEKDEFYEKRMLRLSEEICLFEKHNLGDVLKALIYIIDAMKEQKVVWGVGRGSSCSSYLLYLMGLHDVDPVKYDIEITDFLK